MRIIIAGGRDFSNYNLLKSECDRIIGSLHYSQNYIDYEVISGDAPGADTLGKRYAKEKKYRLIIMSAKWDLYGKSAGYIRNKKMRDYAKLDPDYSMLIAFWDGKSKGTKNMIDLAKEELDKIEIIKY
jgi:hypothetical protein